jgi:DNA polymerase-3 subunit delta
MATKNYKSVVHDAKNNRRSSVNYFYGSDVYSVSKLTKKFFENVEYIRYDGGSFAVSRLEDDANQFSMFADFNAILVNDLDCEKLLQSDFERLMNLLQNIPDTTIIVFNITGIDIFNGKKFLSKKNSELINLVKQLGVVCEMNTKTTEEIADEIVKKCEEFGCEISVKNAKLISNLTQENLLQAMNEVDKLCSCLDSGKISEELIRNLITPKLETNVFGISKAITLRNRSKSLRILNDLLITNAEPVAILAIISNSFIDLYRAKLGQENTVNDFDYKGRDFVVRNLIFESQNLSLPYLRKCLEILAETDLKLKSSHESSEVLIEKAIVQMMI